MKPAYEVYEGEIIVDDANNAQVARDIKKSAKPEAKPAYEEYKGEVIPASPQYDVGNSFVDDVGNFAQGVRKGVVDTGLGIRQRFDEAANALESRLGGEGINKALGMKNADEILSETNKVIEDRKRYYEPLSNTKAGIAGDVTGQVGIATPLAFVPGAATIRGSAAIGGAQGFFAPTTGDDSVLLNTAVSTALGGALPLLYAGGKLGKSYLYDPFMQPNIDKRAIETLKTYGVKPEHLANVDSRTTLTGARPTMAEQIIDPEAAAAASKLQDNLATLPNQQRKFAVRNMENNEARLRTLEDVAGVGGRKTQAEAARAAGAAKDYGEAYKVPFDLEKMPQSYKTAHGELMAKPAIHDAMKLAEKEAANRGDSFDPNTSVESLHLIKESLDKLINKAEAQGQHTVGLTTTKNELVGFLKNVSKRYDAARVNFSKASVPINQMDVAGELIKRGTSPTPDLYGNPQLRVGGLLQAMRDEPGLIKRSTGGLYGGDGTLRGLMDPEQFSKVNAVAEETGRKSAVTSAGLGSGSPTEQRRLGVDILKGGAGLATGGKANAGIRAVSYIKDKFIEPRIQETLTEMVLNPGKAQEIMKGLLPKDRTLVREALESKALHQSLKSLLPALYNSEN